MGERISSVHLPDITAIAPGRYPHEDRFDAVVPDSLCRDHGPNLPGRGLLAAECDGVCLDPTAHAVGQETAAEKDGLNFAFEEPLRAALAGGFGTGPDHPHCRSSHTVVNHDQSRYSTI